MQTLRELSEPTPEVGTAAWFSMSKQAQLKDIFTCNNRLQINQLDQARNRNLCARMPRRIRQLQVVHDKLVEFEAQVFTARKLGLKVRLTPFISDFFEITRKRFVPSETWVEEARWATKRMEDQIVEKERRLKGLLKELGYLEAHQAVLEFIRSMSRRTLAQLERDSITAGIDE